MSDDHDDCADEGYPEQIIAERCYNPASSSSDPNPPASELQVRVAWHGGERTWEPAAYFLGDLDTWGWLVDEYVKAHPGGEVASSEAVRARLSRAADEG